MKNQYFGDVNDYLKYGLLRALQAGSGLRLLVAWMLTPDDGRPDGGFTDYLRQPARWEGFDSELFRALREFLADDQERKVDLIEATSLLPRARYFADLVPDARNLRERWSQALCTAASGYDLVFLDPDNGLEVPSTPLGRAGSCKYVYWSEVERLWKQGSSLLIYQHFPRRKRAEFIRELTSDLASRTGALRVEAFQTPRVLFLLAAQDHHEEQLLVGIERVQRRWESQIKVFDFWDWRRGPSFGPQLFSQSRSRGEMVSGADLRETLERTLTAERVDYAAIIDEFGQVQACEQRSAGKSFDLSEHVRGLILAQLSNQRPWGPIAANLDRINKIFMDYDPEALKVADPDELVARLRSLKCGNRAILAQMEGLAANVRTLERIQLEHGSVDAFVTDGPPDKVARVLSDPGPYKLQQIGYTLALEYLRNVGIPAIKPDVHVRRALSDERLRVFDHYPSEEETYSAFMELARAADCNPTYLDNLLWIFCAQDYAAICGAEPRCGLCGFRDTCNYGEKGDSSDQGQQTVLPFPP